MTTFVELFLEAARLADEKAAKAAKEKVQTAASVRVVDKKTEPAVVTPDTFVIQLQKKCQAQIAQDSWGRIFNNFPHKLFFDQEKFRQYLDRYHKIGVAISTVKISFETHMINLEEKDHDPTDRAVILKMKTDVKQWMDDLINEICHLFLNTHGEIRKDILSLLGLKEHELALNRKKIIVLNSCLEEMSSSIVNDWPMCKVRRKDDKEKVFLVKDDLKLSTANLTILNLIQLYVKDESNMKKVIANFTSLMQENIEAKRARAHVLLSETSVKYLFSLEDKIEAELTLQIANDILRDRKIRSWVSIAYHCIADGDYVSPRAFLNVCKKLKLKNYILNNIGGEYATKLISCLNCVNYLDEGKIKLLDKDAPNKPVTVMYAYNKTAAAPATGSQNPAATIPLKKAN